MVGKGSCDSQMRYLQLAVLTGVTVALLVPIYLFNRYEVKQLTKYNELSLNKESISSNSATTYEHLVPMILALQYWEQFSNGLKNLFDLQCWAKSVDIAHVVEPSVHQNPSSGVFGFSTSPVTVLGDLLDLDHWNSIAVHQNYSLLVTMQYFLRYAVKDIVLVQLSNLKQPSKHCKPLVASFQNSEWYSFLKRNGFSIIKTVCIDFKELPGHSITHREFYQRIVSDLKVINVTIIFDFWSGIRNDSGVRVALTDSKCSAVLRPFMRDEFVLEKPSEINYFPGSIPVIKPSKKMLSYADKFLSAYLDGESYIAVMVRTEKLDASLLNPHDECVEQIISDWTGLTKDNNISRTFLFSDVGKHGSYNWKTNPRANNFISYLSKKLLVSNEVNSLLDDIIEKSEHVKVAFLQSILVTRASCVIMLGGGLFQRQTLNRFAYYHSGHECYTYRDSACIQNYIEHFRGINI